MNYRRILLTVGALLLLSPLQANAEILVEPYVGYEAGKLTATTTASNSSWSSFDSGVDLGARVGFKFPLIFAALDYTYAMVPTTGSSGSAAPQDSSNSTRSSLGAVAGVKIPFFRAYAGYGFLDSFTLTPSTGNVTLTGTSVKLGVSFTALPFIYLNLEYIMSTYNNSTSSIYSSSTNNALLASVSLPLEF